MYKFKKENNISRIRSSFVVERNEKLRLTDELVKTSKNYFKEDWINYYKQLYDNSLIYTMVIFLLDTISDFHKKVGIYDKRIS